LTAREDAQLRRETARWATALNTSVGVAALSLAIASWRARNPLFSVSSAVFVLGLAAHLRERWFPRLVAEALRQPALDWKAEARRVTALGYFRPEVIRQTWPAFFGILVLAAVMFSTMLR